MSIPLSLQVLLQTPPEQYTQERQQCMNVTVENKSLSFKSVLINAKQILHLRRSGEVTAVESPYNHSPWSACLAMILFVYHALAPAQCQQHRQKVLSLIEKKLQDYLA